MMDDLSERIENVLKLDENDVVEFPKWELREAADALSTLSSEVSGLQNALAWFVNRAEDHGIVGTAAMLKKVGIDLATLSPVSTKQGPCDE